MEVTEKQGRDPRFRPKWKGNEVSFSTDPRGLVGAFRKYMGSKRPAFRLGQFGLASMMRRDGPCT